MEEKNQKPLTVGDILDQLVKPSAIQNLETSRPNPPPLTLPPSPTTGTSPGIRLPQLAKRPETPTGPSIPSVPQSPELRLSIRTMADDLARLKQGQKPVGLEVQKSKADITVPPQKLPPPPPIRVAVPQPPPIQSRATPPPLSRPPLRTFSPPPISTRPAPAIPDLPPIPRPGTPPPISTLPTIPSKEPEHTHPEKIISKGDLPAFLGAPVLQKKAPKKLEERIEYGVLAKIISSGMTTGIISTIVVAVIVYFLLSYFFFNQEEAIVVTPTPTPTSIAPTPEINELETIFKSVPSVNFALPQDKEQTVGLFLSFIKNQTLVKKEFKRINFTPPPEQTNRNINFTELLSWLSIEPPPSLANSLKTNNLTLIYGQEESFTGQTDSKIPTRIVFIGEAKDLNQILAIMREWELKMPNDLKNIFELDPAKQASSAFLENDRQGVKIKYKNFPLPDKSIDYAIVSSLTGRHYLILTNSRESMYSPTDKLRGISN